MQLKIEINWRKNKYHNSTDVPSIRIIPSSSDVILLHGILFLTFKFWIRFLKGDIFSQWTWGYELGTYRSNKIVSHHLEASHVRFRVVAQPVCRCIATNPTCPRRETLRLSWMLPQGIDKVNSRSESQLSWQNPFSQVATGMFHICSARCWVMKRICSVLSLPSVHCLTVWRLTTYIWFVPHR